MKIYHKLRHVLRTHPYWSGLVVLIVLGGFGLAMSQSGEVLPPQAVVTRGDIQEEVSVTGKVKPVTLTTLSFEKGGRVVAVNVVEGSVVYAGQVLVVLSASEASADLAEAKAGLAKAEANLASVLAGATPEELVLANTKTQNARENLTEILATANDVLASAYSVADDAVRNKLDLLFDNPRSTTPLFKASSDVVTRGQLSTLRVEVETLLNDWQGVVYTTTDTTLTKQALVSVRGKLLTTKKLLDEAALSVNALVANSSLTQTTIDAWKLAVATARTSVNTELDAVSAMSERVTTAQNAVLVAENELAIKTSGGSAANIAVARAGVTEASARVSKAEVALARTAIVSPIAGVVTTVVPQVGEIVTVSTPAVTVISHGQYEIETYVPEVDIAKVKIGDSAKTTLDAYGSTVRFDATVIRIDPAETIREGVATYRTTLVFNEVDERIKSGMTANLDIVTAVQTDTLLIPSRFVRTVDGERFVNLLVDGVATKTPVTTGLRGVTGQTEILTGLKEGDIVREIK